MAVCASGSYVAGALWPPAVQHFVAVDGWRPTCIGMGLFSGLAMATLALLMRPRPPAAMAAPSEVGPGRAAMACPSARSLMPRNHATASLGAASMCARMDQA